VTFAACGGGGDDAPDLSQYDPRCQSACAIETPPISGVGDVCNGSSQRACLDECEARIADVETTCASCLVEDVCFAPEGDCGPQLGDDCSPGAQTTVTGWNGSCSYPCGDSAAREACLRQVSPRREVACSAEFRPVAECDASCP
jgi:hypothetical protein